MSRELNSNEHSGRPRSSRRLIHLIVVLGAVLACRISVFAQFFCFEVGETALQTESAPGDLAAVDLDGDGDNDVAVCSGSKIQVFRNNGGGIFAAPYAYPVGSSPSGLCAADIDGDSDQDLIGCNKGQDTVFILRNDGYGGFFPHSHLVVGRRVLDVCAADFNRDGRIDLAASCQTDTVAVLINRGNGSFDPPPFYHVGSRPNSIVAADFDQDGNPDLATVNAGSNNVSILFGFGDGTFFLSGNYLVGNWGPLSLFAVDFNGDLHPDLGICYNGPGNPNVLLSQGNRFFDTVSVSPWGFAMAPGDFDGDGDLDLACAGEQFLSVYRNDGALTFAPWTQRAVELIGQFWGGVYAADLDGDGNLDLLANSMNGNYVVLLWNCHARQTASMPFRPYPDGWGFSQLGDVFWPESWWQQFNQNALPYCLCMFRILDWCQPGCPPAELSSTFPDWPSFVRAFGERQCYIGDNPDKWNREAVDRWIANAQEYDGACFGFSVTAFLYFDGYLSTMSDFDMPYLGFVDLSWQSTKPRDSISEYYCHQYGQCWLDYVNKKRHSASLMQTLNDCRATLNSTSTPRDDRFLLLYNHRGGAHALCPYRCVTDRSNPGVTRIYVYDPNAPNKPQYYDPTTPSRSSYVTVNTIGNFWLYTMANGSPWWGGEKDLILSEPVSNYALKRPVLSRSGSLSGCYSGQEQRATHSSESFMEMFASGGDEIRLESSWGTIGIIGDSVFSTLSDGIPIVPIVGSWAVPVGYYIPEAAWSVDMVDSGDSPLEIAVFLDSLALIYSRHTGDTGEHEAMTIDGSGRSIRVTNPDGAERFVVMEAVMTFPDSQVSCAVTSLRLGHGDSVALSAAADSGVIVQNFGGGRQYDLWVAIQDSIDDTAFFHSGIPLQGSAQHLIRTNGSAGFDTLTILIDSGMTGTFVDSLKVVNESIPSCLCHCHADPECDGARSDIRDVVKTIDVAFRGSWGTPDPSSLCPSERTDVNCDGFSTVQDVVKVVNVAFRGANPATEFCDPCGP